MQPFGEPHEREMWEAHEEERRAPQRNSLNPLVSISPPPRGLLI
jgi:hypothetical protein